MFPITPIIRFASRTLRRESVVRWYGLSLAPSSKHNERFARQYRCSTRVPLTLRFSSLVHHLSGPDKTKKTLFIYIYMYVHTYLPIDSSVFNFPKMSS